MPNSSSSASDFWEDEEYCTPTYFNDPEFIAYRSRIEALLKRDKRALCTRDIHSALKAPVYYHWTMDALETSKEIAELEAPIQPARFVHFKQLEKVTEEINERRRWNNNHLYADNAGKRKRNKLIPYGSWE